jgi:hypothetical protein
LTRMVVIDSQFKRCAVSGWAARSIQSARHDCEVPDYR